MDSVISSSEVLAGGLSNSKNGQQRRKSGASSNQRGNSSGQKNRKSSGRVLIGHPMLGEDGMSEAHMMLY